MEPTKKTIKPITKYRDMTDNPIFEILTQLESDLKSIKAAKEQVDEVLDADGKITKNLAEYSLQLASIASQLGSLQEFIKSEMKELISDIDSDITARLAAVDKLVSNIADLSSEIEGNAKKVVSNTAETLDESCAKVLKSFEATSHSTWNHFSKQTSESVDKLAQTAVEMNSSAKNFSDSKVEMIQKIDDLASSLLDLRDSTNRIEKAISSLANENAKQAKDLRAVNGNVDLVRSEVKNFKALFQDAVTTIEEKNDQTKNKLLEAIDTNKKISFGIIVLVIIDIILRFV